MVAGGTKTRHTVPNALFNLNPTGPFDMIRLFCLMLLMYTIALWSFVPGYKNLPPLAHLAMHGFYALGTGIFVYGFITGRAPS